MDDDAVPQPTGNPRPLASPTVIELLGEGLVMQDADGVVVDCNDTATRLLGTSRDRLLGKTSYDPEWRNLHQDGTPFAVQEHPAVVAMATMSPCTDVLMRVEPPGLAPRWLVVDANPVVDDGRVVQVVVSFRDASDRIAREAALEESERQLSAVLSTTNAVVSRWSLDRRMTYSNQTAALSEGLDVDTILGLTGEEMGYSEEELSSWNAAFDRALKTREATNYEVCLPSPGGPTWFALAVTPEVDAAGQVVSVTSYMTDVSDLHRATEALALREQLYRTTVEAAPIGMALVDLERRFVEVNPSLCTMLDRSASWLRSHRLLDVVDPGDDAADLAARARLTTGETEREVLEQRLVRPDGTRVWVEHSVALVRSTGRPSRFVSQFVDISGARAAREELVGLANTDPLTGLANRARVLDEIGRAQASGRRTGRSTAVLMVDLDQFKHVNDSLGHAVGDELLRAAADRIGGSTRSSDLAARLGGDEFVVVMRDLVHPDEGERAAWRLVRKFRRPLLVDDLELYTTASIGVAVSNSGDAGDLLREADTAMYVAKDGGRDRVAVFNEDLRVAATRRLELEGQLRQALARGELMVWYQPEVDLRDGSLTAVEALLRWRRSDGEVWTADRFVDVAEETGLILDVGDWVLLQAFGQAAAWAREQAERPIDVRFNLSALQLAESGLADAVDAALDLTGADPAQLCAEITETAFLRRTSTVTDNLAMLRERGIRLAIDDFGTGYASLAYLRDYPADVVKIDRSFVTDLTDDAFDRRLVGGVIALAQRLGMSTTAEGVEHQVQADILRRMGCDGAQGYLYSKAVPPETVTDLRRHVVMPTAG